MKIYTSICYNLVLTQFWPKVVSWRFEITTDEMQYSQSYGELSFIKLFEQGLESTPWAPVLLQSVLQCKERAGGGKFGCLLSDGTICRKMYQCLLT